MSGTYERDYPDDSSGPFPAPPTTFEDGDGRPIDVRAPDSFDAVIDDVVGMYDAFDPTDRAQGIPPTGEDRIRNWLETISGESINVVARHDGDVVAHAMLVPDADEPPALDLGENENENAGEESPLGPGDIEWELAIFVLQEYQRAGIGTVLLKQLLGHAGSVGITHVWLTVERWNNPAIALYERVGFERTGGESFEQEMAIRLEPTDGGESDSSQTE
ncbi:GNAT family N-acetyltransferase [Halobiforma nitratireducens]|uniref:GCN5-like N-acetyltransferase n=1 Tax=Halobiforma nitratireducens JCM 10879 TaxID=1227454 RepID=M0LK84_9EURY|nr:GNAT family N-acetyltransferase [Halobiforma nitratireducens]EMA32425.1 GCN5-like N-acetyltransferase [Halobiforma nitratireducens JCM 10879]